TIPFAAKAASSGGLHSFLSAHGIGPEPVVSVVKIRNGRTAAAVEEAIDLLGGMETVAKGKERIMVKPNLVAEGPAFTTKPDVVRALVRMMKRAGKDVSIGEGSAAAGGFNVVGEEVYRTKDREILDRMQQYVYDQLGYTDLAKSDHVPLLNLHTGDMVDVAIPDGLAFDSISLHHSLTEIDLLCSVPMMKTHELATVTLGMKNLIGLYPGQVYASVRGWVHDHARRAGSPGIAFETVDMVRANKLGLVVVDASSAMEGQGPTEGRIVDMGLIIAGTNPLATDMVAASLMGFRMREVPTFGWAQRVGMTPGTLDEIEVRGEKLESVRRRFRKPDIVSWDSICRSWGVKEL
ncbi:MAG: DUF362 domain-containing protein, partial [Bacteroidota bacterium]